MKNNRCVMIFLGIFIYISASMAEIKKIDESQLLFFNEKVLPVLDNHCLRCHSVMKGKVKGGLSFDNREDILRGGDNGKIINLQEPDLSPVIAAIEWHGETQMPPKKKLNKKEIDTFKQWIKMGLPDSRKNNKTVMAALLDHWAFKPISKKVKLPQVKNTSWRRNEIDQFIIAKLEEKNMKPSPQPEEGGAEQVQIQKEALLRRAYFDLIGLPPTPIEIQSFVNDQSKDAFEKVIDKLLGSKHYGERWARHWMDTVRYSDTGGVRERGYDQRFPYAWGYRDWLIRAFNKDMPYDEFIKHQIAADKISAKPNENWAALAFITVGQNSPNNDEVINDRIDAVGRGFLGLTLTCARCHNHKFDPVTIEDYYALHGVFNSIKIHTEGPVINEPDKTSAEYKVYLDELKKLQDKAWATYLYIAKRENAHMQEKAYEYFLWAFAMSKKITTKEQQEKLEILKDELKLDGEDTYWVRGEFAPNFKFNGRDPVLGPFVALAEQNQKYYDEIMSGRRKGYNPIVISFFKSLKKLPKNEKQAAALFRQFWVEVVKPYTGVPVNPKSDDFIKEVESKGGMVKQIWFMREDVADHKNLPLMELAVYPWRLIVPGLSLKKSRRLRAEDSIELKLLEECRGHDARGSELEQKGRINGINMFKLNSQFGPMRAMSVEDLPKPKDSPLYPRGNRPASWEPAARNLVKRRYLEAFDPTKKPFENGSGRLELANKIASRENPLTARVLVNRVWMYLFGQGIVKTPDDLGNRSGEPSHPLLLDYLSSWFMNETSEKKAWSIKALQKYIMLSAVYQQSSINSNQQAYVKVDPSNSLLWRSNIRRLDFESFRDSILVMSGKINLKLYGPPENLVREPYSYRRSIYGYIDRSDTPDLLRHFDFANPNEPNTSRHVTIVPQQALFLMNSPFIINIVRDIVDRVEVQDAIAQSKEKGIQSIYKIIFQRTATKTELFKSERFLENLSENQAQENVELKDSLAKDENRAVKLLESRKEKEKVNSKASIVNKGEIVERKPLSSWEALVQSLLFCNETCYLK